MKKNILLVLFTLVITTRLFGQTIEKLNYQELTEEKKEKIIFKLDSLIASDYLDSNKAKITHYKLQEMLHDSRFSSIKDTRTLESVVNSFLQQATADAHLKFYFDQRKYNLFLKPDVEIEKGEAELFRKINYGLQKVEILPGNIGYIKINKFQNLNDVMQTAIGAMQFISNTDAVIFDLRNNGGGDGRTAKLFLNYFLEDTSAFRLLGAPVTNSSLLIKNEHMLYILIGKGTFSAAEGFTSDILTHKRGIAIGEQTKGGGHSGRSIPLNYGFLVFLPTGVSSSKIEGKGISPNISVNERDALIKAQEIILKDLQMKAVSNEEKENYDWFLESISATFKKIEVSKNLLKPYTGMYQGENEILLVNKDLYLKNQGQLFQLLPITNNYFIVSGFDDFGKGNARIKFESKYQAVFIVNQGTSIVEKVFKKL